MATNKGKSTIKKSKPPSKSPAAAKKVKKSPPARPVPQASRPADLRDRIARKAYELYQKRGEVEGRDLQDWLDAEAILRDEIDDSRK